MKRKIMKKNRGFALLLAGLMMMAATGCDSDVGGDPGSEGTMAPSAPKSSVTVQRSTATVLSQKEFTSAFSSRGELETVESDVRVWNVDSQENYFYYRDVTNEAVMESLGQSAFVSEYESMRTVKKADLKDTSQSIDTEAVVMKDVTLVEQGKNFYIYNASVDYEESSEHYACESVFVEQDGKIYEIQGLTKNIQEIRFQKTMSEIVSIEAPLISGKEFEDIMSEYGEVETNEDELFDYQVTTDEFDIMYGKDLFSMDQLKVIGTDEFVSVIKSVIKTDSFSLSNIDLKALGSNYYHYSATQIESGDIKVPCDMYFFVENGKMNIIMGDSHGEESEAYKEALMQVTGLTV